MLHADRPAGQKDPHTEVFKIMHPTGIAFDLFDSAVKAFTGGIGLPIFPGIQNALAETPDALVSPAQLWNLGRQILADSFGEQETLELLYGMVFPVGFPILLRSSEQAGGMLEDGIRGDIALKTERILDADTQVMHTLVQQADDVEVVIADNGPRKTGRASLAKPACISQQMKRTLERSSRGNRKK